MKIVQDAPFSRKFAGSFHSQVGSLGCDWGYYPSRFIMFRLFSELRSASLLGMALLFGPLSAADAQAAGGVAYRNDTSQVVVVQSMVMVNGVARRGKAQMLSPGEVAVDGLLLVGPRRITVYDPKKPNTPLFQ